MRRRDFIIVFGGAASTLAWPSAASARQARVHRIGVLLTGDAYADSFRSELRQELRESGYVEERDILFEFRSAEGKLDLLPKFAAELVALNVDLIVAVFTPCAVAAPGNA